jgi:thiamine kinase-like enzyme
LEDALHGGVQSLCFKGHRENGSLVVLKVPSVAEDGLLEVAALNQWNSFSELEILEIDEGGKGFLMSYIENAPHNQTLSEVVNLFSSLHEVTFDTKVFHQFPQVEKFINLKVASTTRRLSNSPDVVRHTENLEVAKAIFTTLLQYQLTHKFQTLLHGDAKNHNILTPTEGLVAIDPQPCLGDKLYDIGMWVAGSVHEKPILDVLSDYTAESNLHEIDMQRLLLWVWALAVVENRPHNKPYAISRQNFINEFSKEILSILELFKDRNF